MHRCGRSRACRRTPQACRAAAAQSAMHVRRRRLAVRASDADRAHGLRRRTEEAIGDRAENAVRFGTASSSTLSGTRGAATPRCRFPQDRSRAGVHRLSCEADAVRARSRQRDECAAGLHGATVEREIDDRRCRQARRQRTPASSARRSLLRMLSERGCIVLGPDSAAALMARGSPARASSPAARSSPSGGTPSKRSAPAMTLANTGAATSPP